MLVTVKYSVLLVDEMMSLVGVVGLICQMTR